MENKAYDLFMNRINDYGKKELSNYSALNLAYIGDAVFEILVRTEVMLRAKTTGHNLHLTAKEMVRAKAQSEMFHILLEHLSEEELAVMKRGRNAKSYSKAKNATMSDYRHATGLEALFGYLYLTGNIERLKNLFEICLKVDKEPNE